MMTRKLCALLLLVAASAIHTAAQDKSATTIDANAVLAPVSWLVGGTWVTDIKDPSSGSVTHVENHIKWAPNHQAIEFNTDFNGKPHYNGFYAYNPATKTIGFYYTNSEGQFTIGTATPDADGKTLRQDFEVTEPNGKTNHVRSTVVRDGDNAYWFTVFLQQNGDWAQIFKIRYERK